LGQPVISVAGLSWPVVHRFSCPLVLIFTDQCARVISEPLVEPLIFTLFCDTHCWSGFLFFSDSGSESSFSSQIFRVGSKLRPILFRKFPPLLIPNFAQPCIGGPCIFLVNAVSRTFFSDVKNTSCSQLRNVATSRLVCAAAVFFFFVGQKRAAAANLHFIL